MYTKTGNVRDWKPMRGGKGRGEKSTTVTLLKGIRSVRKDSIKNYRRILAGRKAMELGKYQ